MKIFVCVFAVLFAAPGFSQPGYAASTDKRGSLLERGPAIGLSAAEIEQAQLATGLVVCPDIRGSGALVLSNQIIVTAAHLFFDEQDRLRRTLRKCHFELQSDPHVRVKLDATSIVFGTDRYYLGGDWAVVRLVSPIQNARPYRPLPLPREGNPLPEGSRLFSIAAGARGFNGNPKVPIVQECTVKETRFNGRSVLSDCMSSFGMSGSIVLTRGAGDLLAAGITTGSITRQRSGNAHEEQFSTHATLHQEFLDAIANMARCGKATCE
jgi:hypothetical protein